MTGSPEIKFKFRNKEGWFDLLRPGQFPKTEHGKYYLQIVTPDDLRGLVRIWEADGKPEFLIDSDHLSYNQNHDTRSLGWGTGLRVSEEPEGVFLQAQARWSRQGMDDLESGAYRLCSISNSVVEFPGQPADAGSSPDNRLRVSPLRLDTIGLTNKPNVPGLRTITHRADGPPETKPSTNQKKRMDTKEFAALMGLPETASDAEIIAAHNVLKNRASGLDKANEAAADAILLAHKEVIAEVSIPLYRNGLLTNREETIKIIEALPKPAAAPVIAPVTAGAGGFTSTPIHNRAGEVTPKPPGGGAALTEDEKGAQLRAAIIVIKNRNPGITETGAFDIVASERPELVK